MEAVQQRGHHGLVLTHATLHANVPGTRGEGVVLQQLADQFEAASLSYVEANGLDRDGDWFVLKMQEELGELTQAWNKLTGRGRRRDRSEHDLRDDLANEAADLLGHVLLFARWNHLDMQSAIERKWRFTPCP